MKSISVILLLVCAHAVIQPVVEAHGSMISPPRRAINPKYRSEALFGLRGAGDEELQLAPLENLRARGQADQPAAPTFDIMNGCRGIEYVEGGQVTEVAAGAEVPIKWMIQAPHPGYMEMHIVRAKKDSSGKTTYVQSGDALKRIDSFANAGGEGSTSVTIPSNLSGCGTAGECALQMYWHSDIASQTYVTCSDIVVKGSGSAPAPAPAPAPAATPAASPSFPSQSDTSAGEATPKPANKCVKRLRRSRKRN